MFWNNCTGNRESIHLALVTGATSGIGLALCHLLANKGINLIVHGRDQAKLSSIAEELGGKVDVQIVQADLEFPEQQQKIVDIIAGKKPDLLINNAGFGYYGEALSFTTDEQMSILQVDGQAAIRLTLEAARTLIANGRTGVIMNVSSAAAFIIFPYFAMYSAAKALINQFSESFDVETRPHGVRILAACPGVVATNFRSRAGGKSGINRDTIKPMTAEFAASEIWKQIVMGQSVRIFNWKYRLATFFGRYIMPKKLLAGIMKQNIDRLRSP